VDRAAVSGSEGQGFDSLHAYGSLDLRSKDAKQRCEAKMRSKDAKQRCEAKMRSKDAKQILLGLILVSTFKSIFYMMAKSYILKNCRLINSFFLFLKLCL
jgi:hypothetical protein